MNQLTQTNTATIHIRYSGRSIDLDLNQLDIGPLSNDGQIREAVASHLGVPSVKLQQFEIDRNTVTGDLTLRPAAVFA
jgi:hypothetical protein